jgi:hypothetical protein
MIFISIQKGVSEENSIISNDYFPFAGYSQIKVNEQNKTFTAINKFGILKKQKFYE